MRPKATSVSKSPSSNVPVPLSMLRCSLFSVSDSDREYVQAPLPIDGVGLGATVRYTGPHLTQRHSLVWQGVLAAAIASGAENGGTFHYTSDGLLRMIGANSSDTRQRRALHKILEDLTQANVRIRTREIQFNGVLIAGCTRDLRTGHLEITMVPKFMEEVKRERLLNDLGRKVIFSRNYLAAWLHDCIASHKVVPTRTVDEIRLITGSELALNKFRAKLRKAMESLARSENPLVTHWEINDSDQLVVRKVRTPVKCNIRKEPTRPDIQPSNQREKIAIDRARQARAKVAL